MNSIEYIKLGIASLFKKNDDIHIIINISHRKPMIEFIPVKIKGVYPNVFCVEETEGDNPKKYSFQYADVLIGRVEIKEFPYTFEKGEIKRKL